MKLTHEQRIAEGWLLNWMGDFDVVMPSAAFDALRDKLTAHPVADTAVAPGDERKFTQGDMERYGKAYADSRDARCAVAPIARPLEDWHEDDGNVVWFTWQDGEWLDEPSYIGQPRDSDWPGYHTHWTPHPAFPANPDAAPTPTVAADAVAQPITKEWCMKMAALEPEEDIPPAGLAAQPDEDKSVCPHCDGEGMIEGDDGISPCACQQDAQEGMPTFGVQKAPPDERVTCLCSGLGPCERPGDVSCRVARATAPQATVRGDERAGWMLDLAKWLRGEAGRHMATMRVAKGAQNDSHALQLKLWADLIEARAASPQSGEKDGEQTAWVALTYEDRKAAFESLPDMLEGFMKKWGWLNFANEIERRCMEKNARAAVAQTGATLTDDAEFGAFVRRAVERLWDSPKSFLDCVQRAISDQCAAHPSPGEGEPRANVQHPDCEPRYRVMKAEGSRYAHVIDTEDGGSVARFDVLKGDGWANADRYANRLNAAQRDTGPLETGEAG